MTVSLPDFDIANGEGRTLKILDTESLTLSQDTQVEQPLRGDWPVAFWSRAPRQIALQYPVTFPPCASLEDAVMESRMVPITCPRGGRLVEYHAGIRNTYDDSWVTGIEVKRLGLTNQFNFSLIAVDPTIEALLLDDDGGIFTDEDGGEFTY